MVSVNRLRHLVAGVVEPVGYDVEALTVSRVGRRTLVRVAVDGDDGVDLDVVASLSRRISAALDAAEARDGELIAGEYDLEVGSPGIDRPLRSPRHWRRNVGRLVRVRADGRQITGRVLTVDDDAVVFDLAGTTQRYVHSELGPGRVQVEFHRDPAATGEGEDEE